MPAKILAIIGSYRKEGSIAQTIGETVTAAKTAGAETETIHLSDLNIKFCINCRECMQKPGEQPGTCIHNDDMAELVNKIEAADGLVLGAPVNFGSINALSQCFIERLAVYAYWPWGAASPRMRKKGQVKIPAVIVTSSAMPAIMARFTTTAAKSLRKAVDTINGKTIEAIHVGFAAKDRQPKLAAKIVDQAKGAGSTLIVYAAKNMGKNEDSASN